MPNKSILESMLMSNNNYTVYHCHDYYSLLDSCTSPEEYIKRASELKMKALCISNHGNLFNWYERLRLCKKHGIKYLHGVECYITSAHVPKIKDNMHTILIAKNMEGFKELNRLMFLANQPDHTYYKHRLSIEEFLNISNNIIKISACIQSPLWKLRNDSEIMDALLKKYDYYEVQYHKFEDNIEFTKMLCDYAKKYNKPLIVGTDTHSINQYKAECRTMLQYGKTESDWGDSENACDLTFKTYDQLVELFLDQGVIPKETVLEALENTNAMADSCEEIVIDTHNKYPYLYGERDEEVLWEVLKKNYKDKLERGVITDSPEYLNSINEEMAIFKKVDMIGFMLFMSEMMSWAKEQHIATGVARGSVAGSMVAFISNITDVDPIRWHTIFSRFCNENRVDIADVDTDWFDQDRQKIYDYIINRFGTEKTGYVLAFGTLAARNTIDTIARGLRKMKPDCKYKLEDMAEIKDLFDTNPKEARDKYPDLFYYYDGLLNTPVSQGQHPAGIIASPINLIDFCGAFLGSDGQQILPLDMDCCHDVGLVKYDILGLKTVGVIDKTCKMIGKHFPRIDEIDFDDQAVFDDMTANPITIFQFESAFAGECLSKMQCHSVFDMSLVNACIRPSGESYRDKLLAKQLNDTGSDLVNNLLSDSYQYLVYQEQINLFLSKICGFSGSDSDEVRRCVDENTQILMADGNSKAIKDIKENDAVMSYNEYDVAEPNKVTNVFDNGIQTVYKIRSNNGYELYATGTHKVLTQDGYKTINELTTNDYIMTPRRINAITDGLKPNKHLSKETMFLLGLMIGDGYMVNEHLHFTNHEMALIKKFEACVDQLNRTSGKCEFYLDSQKGTTVDYIHSVYIKSKGHKISFLNLLKKLDMTHKAADKYIPDELMLYPAKEKIAYLLAGLFNTDGGYNVKSRSLDYSSTSLKLVNQIKSLLLKFGIYSYVHKRWIEEYNQYSYRIIITQKSSLLKFREFILPYMIGEKYNNFLMTINYIDGDTNACDYYLPSKCRDEIRFMSQQKGVSVTSVTYSDRDYALKVSKSETYSTLQNNKAELMIQKIYCPYTYRLLLADYIPMQIKTIDLVGNRHVYDIEVENAHNYVANGIIVHNCIAKKKEDKIAAALPKILEGYCAKSDKPRDVAEQEAKKFLKVIEDSSSYMFGYNHSLAYSLMSYLCGYYRHYYPVEYCTAYISCAKNQDDFNNGRALANMLGITISDIKFRHTAWDYRCDAPQKTIYKGLFGVKYMNKASADFLFKMRSVMFEDFVELIQKAKANKINIRQLTILTKLDFFEEFGSIKYLLKILEIYEGFKTRKKCFDLTREAIKDIKPKPASDIETADYEFDATGTISRLYPNMDKSCYYIIDKQGRMGTLYQMQTGKIFKIKFKKQNLFDKGMLIKIMAVGDDGRWTKNDAGKWVQSKTDFEKVISMFSMLNTGSRDED